MDESPAAVKDILRSNPRIAFERDSFEFIKKAMEIHRIECMPVVNESHELINVFFWEDVFATENRLNNIHLNLPVIIMAGGKGTRLKPLTNVIPKPLIPIGEKTIIEEIMDRFLNVGCNIFYISVNYKADTIKHYFEQLPICPYSLNYFHEDKPLGTVGSLYLIKEKIHSTFFISNCDIIINEDYFQILKYHQVNGNELTIVSALKHYPIPYGIIETSNGGLLSEFKEKPELTFQINSGMYVLEPHLLHEIPENEFYHITQLIEKIRNRGGKVGVFPVSEGSWKDIGEWKEYINLVL